MKTFAVSFYCNFENELTTEVIQAKCWQDAARNHTQTVFPIFGQEGDPESEDNWTASIKAAKEYALNAGNSFDIIELSAGPGDCQIMGYSPEEALYGLAFPGSSDPKKELGPLSEEPESQFGIPKPAKV